MNRKGIADLHLLRTLLAIHQKSQEPHFWEVMNSCFISICQFALLQQLATCVNFTLDLEDSFCWYKRKTWFLWTMAAAQAAVLDKWLYSYFWDEWGLTWCLQWRIYTSISPWTPSQNSFAARQALSLKISSHETSLKWSQRLSQWAQKKS